MKRLFTFGAVILFGLVAGMSSAQASDHVDQAWVTQNLTSMPLAFTQNMGQWDERALFRADAGSVTMWITAGGVYYQFTRRVARGDDPPQAVGQPDNPARRDQPAPGDFDNPASIEQLVIAARFVGGNPNPTVSGSYLLDYKCNYFLGNDPDEWRTDVSNYEAIVLEEVYPGIDVTYYGNGHQMEYDFLVNPGADYSQIQIQYEGAESLAIADDGSLVVATKRGKIRELAPVAFQEVGGRQRRVESEYVVRNDHTFGFRLGQEFDPTLPVVIDPVLIYSTYLGGSGWDHARGIAVDGAGSAYLTGETWSTGFPTVASFDTSLSGAEDVFVTKVSPAGNSLVYSTYLGGTGGENGLSIAVDGAGSAYVTGETASSNFPVLNPLDGSRDGYSDAFVTKLSPAGNRLTYSTYLGGNNSDGGSSIAVDGAGSAYVTGYTYSSNFPTATPFDGSFNGGSYDAFVTKLSATGNSLVFSTYLGGNNHDGGYGIAVNAAGNAYVTGFTWSENFPTVTPFDSGFNGGDYDAFVTKLSTTGNSLVYSTYLGGSSDECGHSIAVDGAGSAYVAGETRSSDFPTATPFDGSLNGYSDAFVTKLNPAGTGLLYSSYLGGSSDEYGNGIVVDAAGNAYVIGWTWSPDFPVANPLASMLNGYSDAFVTKLNPAATSLVYSTYLGGNGGDDGDGIAVDGSGNAYVTGWTYSSDFPTQNHYDSGFNGVYDAFVTKLSPSGCCIGRVGDANSQGTYPDEITLGDIMMIVDAKFISESCDKIACLTEADVNQSGGSVPTCDDITLGDIMILVDFMFINPETATLPECL